jgi:hypothetical protein
LRADFHALRKRRKRLRGISRVAEDVDVEVAGAARLFDAVRQRDRATERVGDRVLTKSVVDREQLFDQLADAATPNLSIKGG